MPNGLRTPVTPELTPDLDTLSALGVMPEQIAAVAPQDIQVSPEVTAEQMAAVGLSPEQIAAAIPPPVAPTDFWGRVRTGIQRAAPIAEPILRGFMAGYMPETVSLLEATEARRQEAKLQEEMQRARLKFMEKEEEREQKRFAKQMRQLDAPTQWSIIYDRAKELVTATAERGEKLPMTEAIGRAKVELTGETAPRPMTLKEVQGQIAQEAYQRGEINVEDILDLSKAKPDKFQEWLEANPKAKETYYKRKAYGIVQDPKDPDMPISGKINIIRKWLSYQKLSDKEKKTMLSYYPDKVPAEDYTTIKTYVNTLPKKYQTDYLRQIAPFAPKAKPTPKKKVTTKDILEDIFAGKDKKAPGKIFW